MLWAITFPFFFFLNSLCTSRAAAQQPPVLAKDDRGCNSTEVEGHKSSHGGGKSPDMQVFVSGMLATWFASFPVLIPGI